MRVRLAAMMFVQYWIPGATIPILSHYLKNALGFEPIQIGYILAMPAVAALAAPLVALRIADRHISSERLLGLCHFCAGCAMLVLTQQTGFARFLGVYLVYGFCFAPTFALTNTVAFHHVRDAKRDFGSTRVWGTLGWIAVAWAFGAVWLRTPGGELASGRLGHALWLSGLCSLAFSAYCFTLGKGHDAGGASKPAPWSALAVFRQPSVLVLAALTFTVGVIDRFYYFGAGVYIRQMGFSDAAVMPMMSTGQMAEVAAMFALGGLLARFRFKTVMLAGLGCEVLRYGGLAVFTSGPGLYFALALHGPCYTFYFATVFIALNQLCAPSERAGAQQLMSLLITGGGVLGSSVLAGSLAQALQGPDGQIDFVPFWLTPAALSCAAAVALVLFLREPEGAPIKES